MVSADEILNASILVVDDQGADVSLLERLLRGAGYTSIASTMVPHDVCHLQRANRYSLILLDLQMPGMDGFQVMEGLRDIEKDAYLPILAITAHPGHKLRALQAGATDFISKPFDLTEVLARVRNLLKMSLLHVKATQANRLKDEFLANMSHELRTPLNAIMGFSAVLRDGIMGEMTGPQRGLAAKIFTSGEHLLALINDILDLSKVEAGKMTLDLEPIQVSSLLVNSLSIIREKAASSHIRLDMEAVEELGSIQVDTRKVKQIIYNLLSNAVKFTHEGGHVTLRAGRVPRADAGHLSGSRASRIFPLADSEFAEFLRISVTDSGIGISPDGLAHLFTPFSQIDGGLARKFEGTGLGLVLVKLLAELHGGTVAVESAAGEGSCFTVWLPLRAPAS